MASAYFQQMLAIIAAGAGGVVSSGNWFFASTFGGIPRDRYNTTAGRPNLAGRARHLIGSGARSKLRVMLPNWSVGSGANNLPANIVGCWLEANGVSVPVTFNGGSTTATMAAGLTKLESDDILPAPFGLASFPVAMEAFIRLEVTAVSGVNRVILSQRYNPSAANKMIEYNPATCSVNTSGTGALAATGGTQGTDWANYTTASMTEICATLIGVFVGADQPVWVVVGDSIPTGDVDSSGTNNDISGFFQRSMFDADLASNPVANFKMSVSGARWTTYSTLTSQLTTWLSYANRGLEELGTNDFGKDTGVLISLATAQTSAQALWGIFRSAGITNKLYRTELLCSTSGTYSTEAGQTVKPGWGAGGNPELFNTWIATQVGSNIDGKIRFVAPYGTDIYKWAPNATGDGLHPYAAMHTTMGAEFRAFRQGIA